MKIFLAEDNEDNYLVIRSNLRKLNADVELIWAEDGKIAIEMLKNMDDIDLFLIDIEMPHINGIELTSWIRSQDKFADKPAIAVTASVFAEMKKMYLEKGFDDILEKPFSRKDLLDTIQRSMNIP